MPDIGGVILGAAVLLLAFFLDRNQAVPVELPRRSGGPNLVALIVLLAVFAVIFYSVFGTPPPPENPYGQ